MVPWKDDKGRPNWWRWLRYAAARRTASSVTPSWMAHSPVRARRASSRPPPAPVGSRPGQHVSGGDRRRRRDGDGDGSGGRWSWPARCARPGRSGRRAPRWSSPGRHRRRRGRGPGRPGGPGGRRRRSRQPPARRRRRSARTDGSVRSRAGGHLGQRGARADVAGRHPGQPAGLLLGRRRTRPGGRAPSTTVAHSGHRGHGPTLLLEDEAQLGQAEARSAVVLGDGQAEQVGLGQLGPQRARRSGRAVPLDLATRSGRGHAGEDRRGGPRPPPAAPR